MSLLTIRLLARDGTLLSETRMEGGMFDAGVKATQLVWHSDKAAGYEVWEGNRAVISMFPPLYPMPADPLLHERRH